MVIIMDESKLGEMVRYICDKKGWNISTISNLPSKEIEKKYNKLKEQEELEAHLKEMAAKEKAKELEQKYSEPYFLTPREIADIYPQRKNLLDETLEMPEGCLVDDFLGPTEANSYNRGRRR